MTLKPLPASQVLDTYFFEARSKLLDLAGMLDRIDRGGGVNDARLEQIKQALGILAEGGPDCAAGVQELFSLPYDPNWKRPVPR